MDVTSVDQDERTAGWIDGCTGRDGRMDGWMDGWMGWDGTDRRLTAAAVMHFVLFFSRLFYFIVTRYVARTSRQHPARRS